MRSKTVLATVISLALVACKAKEARTPHVPLQAGDLRSFEAPQEAKFFKSATFFLWKEGTTLEQAQEVLRISKDYGEREDLADDLNASVDRIKADLKPYDERIEAAKARLGEVRREANRVRREIREEENRDAPDERRLQELRARLAELEAEKLAKQQEKESAEKESAHLREAQEKLEADRSANGLAIANLLTRLIDLVDWYPHQPSSVAWRPLTEEERTRFGVDAPPFFFEIQGWDLGDGAGERVFSTQHGTLRRLSFQGERGGLLSFEAVAYADENRTQERELYRFSLVRMDRKGKMVLNGDLERWSPTGCQESEKNPQGYCVRKGSARLVDKNN